MMKTESGVMNDNLHWVADATEYRPDRHPAHQRVPFGWRIAPVGMDAEGMLLRWHRQQLPQAPAWLRFSVALDQREAKQIEVSLAASGERIGIVDVAFAYSGQPFEIALEPSLTTRAATEGIRLRTVSGSAPLWVFDVGLPQQEGSAYLQPHLFIPAAGAEASRWEAACDYLCSLGSVQPFGWLEGCVLEGLTRIEQAVPQWSAQARQAIDSHLDLFFPEGRMIYESPHGKPVDDCFVSIEGTLMLPALFRYRPEHVAVDWALQFWREQMHTNGIIGGPGYQKCESCYTVAYPLALVSHGRGDARGVEEALRQLVLQHECLVREGVINQAYYEGAYSFPNWARGIGWYLLGIGRTLQITGTDYNADARRMAAALEQAVGWMLGWQRQDGLWNCYVDVPASGVETSGSAGIGAGVLLAASLGCGGADAYQAARRCRDGLEQWLSADGMLYGVSQSNKKEAGDSLQKNGYRCYSQMGLGLAMQIVADLDGGLGR